MLRKHGSNTPNQTPMGLGLAKNDVVEGKDFIISLNKTKVFPNIFMQLISSGYKSGNLVRMFYKASDFLRNEDELTARMAFVDFDGSKALTAISALGSDYQVDYEFLRTHCLNVLEAMDALVAWISKNSK